MIPKFGPTTGNLPVGDHEATWAEVEAALGFSSKRKALLVGLLSACRQLKAAGATKLYLDGSFATKKHNPGDWDACYEPAGVTEALLDPVLLDFTDERAAMKAKYGGEVFPATFLGDLFGEPILSYFRKNRDGRKKGLVVVDLDSLP